MLYSTLLYYTILYNTVLYYTTLHYTIISYYIICTSYSHLRFAFVSSEILKCRLLKWLLAHPIKLVHRPRRSRIGRPPLDLPNEADHERGKILHTRNRKHTNPSEDATESPRTFFWGVDFWCAIFCPYEATDGIETPDPNPKRLE